MLLVRNLMMCECLAFFTSALLAINCCHDIAFLWATGRFAGQRTRAALGARSVGEAAQRVARCLNWGWSGPARDPGLDIRNRRNRVMLDWGQRVRTALMMWSRI